MKFLACFVLTVVCFVVIAESAELQTAEAVALKPATEEATGSAEGTVLLVLSIGLPKGQFGRLIGSALGGGYGYGRPYGGYGGYGRPSGYGGYGGGYGGYGGGYGHGHRPYHGHGYGYGR